MTFAQPAHVEAATVRVKRTHVAELPVSQIKVVPEENYRWGSAALMREELSKTEKDPSDGSLINTYEMLKASIQAIGIEEPIGVVMRDDGFYHVVYGFTRAMAACDLRIAHVSAYVYDPSISDAEARTLQLRENSLALKRVVNWVNEVKMFRDVAKSYQCNYADGTWAVPPGMTPEMAAAEKVCRVLGKSVNTMRSRLQTFEKIDQRVRDLSKEGKFSYSVALEFLPIKEKAGMTSAMVGEIIAEMRRRQPELNDVTPEFVRQVHRWVIETRKALEAPAEPESEDTPTRLPTAHMEQSIHHMSAAAARDTAVEMMVASLKSWGMTDESPAESLEKIKRFPTWERIIGIGIGSSQVLDPVKAGNAFPIHAHNYAMRVLLAAFLRRIIPGGEDMVKFNTWHASLTERGPVKVQNNIEFARAVDIAMSESDHRSPIKAIVTRAVQELRARVLR